MRPDRGTSEENSKQAVSGIFFVRPDFGFHCEAGSHRLGPTFRRKNCHVKITGIAEIGPIYW